MNQCSRKWQVAAARDGRLRGKDLASAERHRDTCAECAQEARELAELSTQMLQLPTLTREAIIVHRTRQQLLSAFNDLMLEPRTKEPRVRAWLAFGAFAALLVLVGFGAAHKTAHPASPNITVSVVEVQAGAEARWTEHLDSQSDRLDFSVGSASFKVRPHPGRRVLIALPDGEIEDLGTVFAVLVRDRATKRVSVSEGRVSLRLRGRPEKIVRAGESWEAEPDAPLAVPSEAPAAATPPATHAPHATASSVPATNTRATAVSLLGSAALASPATETAPVAPSKTDTASKKAEDDVYLHVVALLRAGKEDDARAEAKQYLLRFPNGFRRVEVLNIVTR